MKRSEIVELLTKQLFEDCGLEFHGMLPAQVAEHLLTTVEDAGMLPPAYDLPHTRGRLYDWEEEKRK